MPCAVPCCAVAWFVLNAGWYRKNAVTVNPNTQVYLILSSAVVGLRGSLRDVTSYEWVDLDNRMAPLGTDRTSCGWIALLRLALVSTVAVLLGKHRARRSPRGPSSQTEPEGFPHPPGCRHPPPFRSFPFTHWCLD
jgi:hypothetical protein